MSFDPVSDEAVRRAYDLVEKHGTIKQAADEAGQWQTTIRRHYEIAIKRFGLPDVRKAPNIRSMNEVLESQRLKDEIANLKKQIRTVSRERLDDDTMRSILGSVARAEVKPVKWLDGGPGKSKTSLGEVPVLTWSDWHYGENVSFAETGGVNCYSPAIAEARVKRLVDRSIHLCRDHGPGRYPGAIINLLGDFVSGGLHPELAKTDEYEILPSVLQVRDILVSSIHKMKEFFGKLYIPCVAGNHGRMTPKPEFKRYVYKNADWLIYTLLEREFANDPDVTVDFRPTNDVLYRVYGTKFLISHGDMLGVKGGDGIIGAIGPIVRGEVKMRGQSTTVGRDYDILLIGHWHQQLWLPRVIVSNSLKGFDEYARLQLRVPPTPPTQPLFFVSPVRGITSRWDVQVEDEKRETSEEWISWRGILTDESLG
jgi:hypothetical protein